MGLYWPFVRVHFKWLCHCRCTVGALRWRIPATDGQAPGIYSSVPWPCPVEPCGIQCLGCPLGCIWSLGLGGLAMYPFH